MKKQRPEILLEASCGSITVQLTSCLFSLDSAALFMLNEQQFYFFGQFQTSQTGGQPYCDTSTYVLHLYGMKAQLESTSCIGSECLAPEFDIRRRDDKLSLKS